MQRRKVFKINFSGGKYLQLDIPCIALWIPANAYYSDISVLQLLTSLVNIFEHLGVPSTFPTTYCILCFADFSYLKIKIALSTVTKDLRPRNWLSVSICVRTGSSSGKCSIVTKK